MIQFNKKRGLCGNLACMFDSAMEHALLKEMLAQFIEAGLSDAYPFGRDDYWERKGSLLNSTDGTQHLCPKRLQWAFDHVEHRPEGQSDELTAYYKAWYWWASSEGGVPHGYAIYSPDEHGNVTRRRCTKEEYEAQRRINAKANLGEVTQLDY